MPRIRKRKSGPPEPRSRVFDAPTGNQGVGAWSDEATKIVAFYEKHDDPYQLRIAYRNFGPYSYEFATDVTVKNGEWVATEPPNAGEADEGKVASGTSEKIVEIEARPEELRRSNEVFLPLLGRMHPIDQAASVVTMVIMSPSENTRTRIYAPIDLRMIIDPVTYQCACCSH